MTARKLSVAVIGGGASAALLLAHLFSQEPMTAPANITVFDRNGAFARGIAYGTSCSEHLLNVRAKGMSALDSDPLHFVNWLKHKNFPYGPADFVPRMIYGAYLSELFEKVRRDAANNGSEINLKTESVSSLPKADIVVVATGNSFPGRPQNSESLDEKSGYFDNPWHVPYKKISRRGNVVILGTGLSMADAVLSLDASGFEGTITAISRRGLLPARHTDDPAVWPSFVTGETPATPLEALKLLRAQLRMAERENVPWQAVIDSLRPVTNKTWEGWSDAQKRKFSRLIPFWAVHRHRMAPRIAEVIDGLRQSGRLRIVKDDIRYLTRAAEGIAAAGKRNLYSADAVINCLGYRAEKIFPLDGADVYALGPALSFRLLETTAIPEIRTQSAQIAADIKRSVSAHGA